MRQETLIHLFRREINIENLTDAFWYIPENREGIHFSETYETSTNPDEWANGGYTSEVMHNVKRRKGYLIATIENGCGESYQAVFKEDKEVRRG